MAIRRLAAVAAAVTVAGLAPALPAAAHGSPTTPISRTTACGGDGVAARGGRVAGTAACRAARAATGGRLGAFDNLRRPRVAGDDRRVIPDGRLCSAGLDAYRGLDLPRDDFPATTVTGGRTLRIRYAGTIPHRGTFRIYLTRPGYDPRERLAWADLGDEPIAEVTDPPLRDGSYALSARLPRRTGRHLLYVIWQNSDTPDTYYSCSDLVFGAPAAAPAPRRTSAPARSSAPPAAPSPAAPAVPASPAPAPTSAAPAAVQAPSVRAVTPVSNESSVTAGHWLIVGALLLGGGAAGWALLDGLLRRRRRTR